MDTNLFKKKMKISAKGRRLALLGGSLRADWRAVLAVGLLAIAAGGAYAETRLASVREIAAAGELRRGSGDTLDVPGAIDLVGTLEERGPSPVAPAPVDEAPEAEAGA